MEFRSTLTARMKMVEQIGLFDLSIHNYNKKKLHSRHICTLIKSHKLQKVSIIGCQLIDKDIFHLKASFGNLSHLNLSHNSIGSEGALILGQFMQNNSIIQSLNLSNNRLCGLTVLKSRIVGQVDLSGIEQLLSALSFCQNLKVLDLSANYLGGFTVESVAHDDSDNYDIYPSEMYGIKVLLMLSCFLRDSKSIVELNLRTNGFDDTHANAQMLIKHVTRGSSCKTLCGRSCYKPFASNLTQLHPYRDYYNLAMQDLDSFTGRLLGHEFSHCEKSCTLNLNGNMMVCRF